VLQKTLNNILYEPLSKINLTNLIYKLNLWRKNRKIRRTNPVQSNVRL